jgi:hypothetical protein
MIYTRLPPKRKRPRSGIERGPQRVWPHHERFVRSNPCSILGCQITPVQFAHVRSAANSGTGLKPPSWDGISLCVTHHQQQHEVGQPAFERLYHIDLFAIAAAFVARSPDQAMRDALKTQEDD